MGSRTRTAVVPAVAIRHFIAQPPEVEHTIHAGQNVILGHQPIERPRNEQFQLAASLASQHIVASQKRTQDMGAENHGGRAFSTPPMIGTVLSHTQVQTTARYAHLARDTVKASARLHRRQHRRRSWNSGIVALLLV